MDYTAEYMPSLSEGKEDPSRSGFATEKEAWEYVFSQMCSSCQDERRIALKGEEDAEYKKYHRPEDMYPSECPACSCEWLILPTDKVDAPFEERMEAGGWEPVYKRP